MGDAVKAFFDGFAIGSPAFEPHQVGFGLLPPDRDLFADLVGKSPVPVHQVVAEGVLPLGQPGADLLLKLVNRAWRTFLSFDGGHVLDLHGQSLCLFAINGKLEFGLLSIGIDEALDVLLERFERGFVNGRSVGRKTDGR